MSIRADRDILYFDKKHISIKKSMKKEPPTLIFPDTIQNREYPCLLFGKAVLTVEAAFCGTLVFLALFSVLMLFRILSGYEEKALLLDGAVKEYECFQTKLSALQGLKNGVVISWEEENICCIRKIEKVPFVYGEIFQIPLYQQFCVNPYKGKSMIPEDKKEKIYVYLAEHGTVYHRKENCVYLNPQITAVNKYQLSEKRNRSGAKYYPCKSCSGGETAGYGTIYITPYGDSWHCKKDCPGLKRSIRKVELSGIGNLPPCSKCGN